MGRAEALFSECLVIREDIFGGAHSDTRKTGRELEKVYRAQRKSDGALVAIKKIAIDAMDQKARDKCLKEVRLLQSVHHANIIEYMDSFIEGDELQAGIEYELKEGGEVVFGDEFLALYILQKT